ncbi:MAG: sigma factor-like helix-turn-helix DNA-binding protein, partial [Acutalibacteraceae bacterium]|nr:sigma factor-like helix-turn-helix DNA-binding protein [Acutalibacteraceae bacterium]
ELTQRQVASILGISRSYVSRIETSVLKKLKNLL